MKKSFILLPIMMLALAACGEEASTPVSTDTPVSTEASVETPTSTVVDPTSTVDVPTSTEEPTSTEPGFVLPEGLAHAGTAEDPFSIADAIKVAQATGETQTTESYYIKGTVKSFNAGSVAQYGNINADLVDEGGTDVFTAYQFYDIGGIKFTEETAKNIKVGSVLVVKGPIVNYKGNTPETAGRGAASLVSFDNTNAVNFVLPEDLAHAGTAEDPFSVADAIKVAEATGESATTTAYYVTGVIKSVNLSGAAKYGNIEVVIKDADVDNEFTLYRLKDVDGTNFTAETAARVLVGETIVAVGNIINYNSTNPQLNANGSLVSITEPDPVAVTGVTVASTTLTVGQGKTVAIGATVTPEDATNKELVYEVSDADLAKIEIVGDSVKGVAVGTATIVVKSAENNEFTATITVTVIEATGDVTGTGTTVSMSTFTEINGNVGGDANVSYQAEKGTASTVPAIYSGVIRIYQNGGLFTVKGNNGAKISSVTIGSAMGTTVIYSIDAGEFGNSTSIAENETITVDNLDCTTITFKCMGTNTNTRLYVNSLSVTYVL